MARLSRKSDAFMVPLVMKRSSPSLMVQLILSVPNVSMKVYSTSVPGAVGWVDVLFCWEVQLRKTIAVAKEIAMFLRRDSWGMGRV